MAKSKIVNKDDFDDLTYSSLNVFDPNTGITVLANEHIDSGRWTEFYRLVWSEGENYFSYVYDVPSTEYQEGSESEFDVRKIQEVRPVEYTAVKYVDI